MRWGSASATGWRCSNSRYYSVITPEGCASILWKGSEHAPKAAAALKMTSRDLLRFGIVDEVIPEPLGGAHRDHREAAASLKTYPDPHPPPAQGTSRSTSCSTAATTKYRKIGVFLEWQAASTGQRPSCEWREPQRSHDAADHRPCAAVTPWPARRTVRDIRG